MKKLIFLLIALGIAWYALGKPGTVNEVKAALDGWNVSVSHNDQPVVSVQPRPAQLYNQAPDFSGVFQVVVCCFLPSILVTLIAIVVGVRSQARL